MTAGPFAFREVLVDALEAQCNALVMTPTEPLVFDRERLDRVARSTDLSPVEREIAATVRGRSPNTPVMIMAGEADGQRLWEFDTSFTNAELRWAGGAFVTALLPLYRRFAAAGIVVFAHAQWCPRQSVHLRQGIDQVAAGRQRTAALPAVAALDHWILRNMLLYSTLSTEHVTGTLLPRYMPLLARREQRLQALLKDVPDSFIR